MLFAVHADFAGVDNMSHGLRKPVFGVSHQVRHKLGWTATEDGMRLQILV